MSARSVPPGNQVRSLMCCHGCRGNPCNCRAAAKGFAGHGHGHLQRGQMIRLDGIDPECGYHRGDRSKGGDSSQCNASRSESCSLGWRSALESRRVQCRLVAAAHCGLSRLREASLSTETIKEWLPYLILRTYQDKPLGVRTEECFAIRTRRLVPTPIATQTDVAGVGGDGDTAPLHTIKQDGRQCT